MSAACKGLCAEKLETKRNCVLGGGGGGVMLFSFQRGGVNHDSVK